MKKDLIKILWIGLISLLVVSAVYAEASFSQTSASATQPSNNLSTGSSKSNSSTSNTNTSNTTNTSISNPGRSSSSGSRNTSSSNTSTQEMPSCELMGDVDRDGIITQNDVDLAFELALTGGYDVCADMNEDGVITAKDAQMIYLLIDECSLMGDVDGDGQLTCIDVQCIFDLALGIQSEHCINPQCADMNQDGKITARDAQKLMIQEELDCNNECPLLGDVDGDGQLTCIDVQCIFDYSIGKPTPNCPYIELCGDINQDGVITAGDSKLLEEIVCPNGVCNFETGVCEIETDPEDENGDTGGTGATGTGTGGGGGGLRQCTAEDIVYGEWSACINGIQSREYSLRTRCAGRYQDFLEELERTCVIEEDESIEFIESHSCYDDNPCTKGRWYQRNSETEGKCVFDLVNGISCYKNGVIGVCQLGECIVPETIQQETAEEIIEETNILTGFFSLMTLSAAGLGLLFLILIVLGYISYKHDKSKKTKKK